MQGKENNNKLQKELGSLRRSSTVLWRSVAGVLQQSAFFSKLISQSTQLLSIGPSIGPYSSIYTVMASKKYSQEIKVPTEGAKKGYKYVKCNFCNKVITGGVQRMKAHLACTHKNVIPCPQVPQEVKDEIREFLKQFETLKFSFQRNFEDTIDAGAYFVSAASGSGSGDLCPSVQRGVRGPMDRFVNAQ
ncbi:hypothetical protein E3N88_22909 [Mikania micrantha]|uniref:BED-type domain-containing protein n=1 Tax=Mikania micrantha TaxID=192012 RepID=A0A5N6NEA4_9ASTR|nr:hypothetical protein E3N88_22909 [Mikania micrantha]